MSEMVNNIKQTMAQAVTNKKFMMILFLIILFIASLFGCIAHTLPLN